MGLPKVVVLRWGHRHRDQRLTTHVALTSRALGASGFVISDVTDCEVKKTVEKVADCWGGKFHFEMGQPWKCVVKDWREKNGVIVHLTAYGENIQTQSPRYTASIIEWVTSRTVASTSTQRSTSNNCMSRRVGSSRAEKGSSIRMIRGLRISVRASATLCCWPPDS